MKVTTTYELASHDENFCRIIPTENITLKEIKDFLIILKDRE